MQIDHLELQNFRNFSNLSVDFSPGVNLFVGTNGSGKTSLLEGVNVAVGCFFGSQEDKLQRLIKEKEVMISSGGANGFPTRSRFASVFAESLALNTYWRRTSKNDDNSTGKIFGNYESGFSRASENSELLSNGLLDYKNDIEAIAAYGRHFLNDFFYMPEDRSIAPFIAFYSTQRLFIDSPQLEKLKFDAASGRKNGYLECLTETAIKPVLEDWLGKAVTRRATMQIKDIRNNDNVLQNVEEAIKITLNNFFSRPKDKPLKIYQEPNFDFELFLELDDEHQLPLKYYSDGIRNLLFLVIDMMWRASQLNPWMNFEEIRDNVTGVVTIDEIDLHLHPTWQEKAISLIQTLFPKVQFFITTHSPTVVANFETRTIDALYVIDRDRVGKVHSKYFGKEINSVLRNILGATDRNESTQREIDKLLKLVDKDSPEAETKPLLHELTALLGKDDIAVQRIMSLIHWNKVKKEEESDAIH